MNETGIVFLPEEVAQELSEEQKKLRDRFVVQYLVDFDAIAAAMRVGYPKNYAKDYAQKFMDESYVRNAIAKGMVAVAEDEKNEDTITKRDVRAMLLKEAKNYGPGSSHSARVAALGKLTQVYGMEAAVKNIHEHRGGVMMVPGVASVTDWEQEAEASQEKLARDVRH